MTSPTIRPMKSLLSNAGLIAASVLLITFGSGCESISKLNVGPAKPAPAFVPVNHTGDAKLPVGIRRVILMPLAGGSVASPESVAALDPVLISALQLQNRFEVVPLTRVECRRYFQVDEISSVSEIPANLMSVLEREYSADAVLFIDLTVYRAYHPLAIGLRAKLASLADAHLVWSFDNVFSADDPAVASSATRYLKGRDQGGLPADLGTVDLDSPVRFGSYVSSAMFATLPPINGSTPKEKSHRDRQIER
jgi:hypothetical protein